MLDWLNTGWGRLVAAAIVLYVTVLWTWALGGFSEQSDVCEITAAGKNCESYNIFFATAWKFAKTTDHWSALITALATGVVAWFTATIWITNRRQLSHAHQVERAYISGGGVPEMRAEGRAMGSLKTGKVVHIPVPTGRFTIHINNQGKTPGEIFQIAIEFCTADAVPAEPIYTNRIHHQNWIGPGTQSRALFSVPIPADLADPIVYGRFFYRDIFSETVHSSGFFQDIDRRTGQSQSAAPPSRAYTEWD